MKRSRLESPGNFLIMVYFWGVRLEVIVTIVRNRWFISPTYGTYKYTLVVPDAQWDWPILTYTWPKFMVDVGK